MEGGVSITTKRNNSADLHSTRSATGDRLIGDSRQEEELGPGRFL
jgi:hypothetical protein